MLVVAISSLSEFECYAQFLCAFMFMFMSPAAQNLAKKLVK